MRGPCFKIGLVGNCHAANSVGLEVFPDQFVWIAVGRIGRQKKQPQSAVLAVDKSSGLLGNVGGAAIDDQENRALGAGHQALEKLDEDCCIHPALFFDHEPHMAAQWLHSRSVLHTRTQANARGIAVEQSRPPLTQAQKVLSVNGGQDPRKDGGAKFFGMTFADGLAAPCRRPLGGNQRPGGKRCQRRKPPEAGAEGPR